jgi:adenosylcobinamide-GDP ribazoletransferase
MTHRLAGIAAQLRLGLAFYTRLPLGGKPDPNAVLSQVLWTGPLAGVVIGLIGALAYALVKATGLPPLVAAAAALGALLATTGCLHEDGLADTADGLGGGATRERKLEIMHDSRIGTYGVCALSIALLLRVAAIASLAEIMNVVLALVAAHAGSRAMIPAFMRFVPPARRDGVSAGAGRPSVVHVGVALGLGLVALGAALGIWTGLIAGMLVVAASCLLAALSLRQIGGQTGDVLGTLQQVSEILILLSAVFRSGLT